MEVAMPFATKTPFKYGAGQLLDKVSITAQAVPRRWKTSLVAILKTPAMG